MLLDINVYNLIYTTVFLLILLLSYFIVLNIYVEKLFKQGAIWPIRIFQVFLAIIIAYLVTSGIMGLVSNTQFVS